MCRDFGNVRELQSDEGVRDRCGDAVTKRGLSLAVDMLRRAFVTSQGPVPVRMGKFRQPLNV